jgi:hypothetical protein
LNLARAMQTLRAILPADRVLLLAEDKLDTGAHFRARRVGRLLAL